MAEISGALTVDHEDGKLKGRIRSGSIEWHLGNIGGTDLVMLPHGSNTIIITLEEGDGIQSGSLRYRTEAVTWFPGVVVHLPGSNNTPGKINVDSTSSIIRTITVSNTNESESELPAYRFRLNFEADVTTGSHLTGVHDPILIELPPGT